MILVERITLECGSCGATKTRTDIVTAGSEQELLANIFDAFDRDEHESRYMAGIQDDGMFEILCAQCADSFIGRGEW